MALQLAVLYQRISTKDVNVMKLNSGVSPEGDIYANAVNSGVSRDGDVAHENVTNFTNRIYSNIVNVLRDGANQFILPHISVLQANSWCSARRRPLALSLCVECQ